MSVPVNLHTHLEGRVRPSTAAELASAAGVPEPTDGWEAALSLDGPADLTTYLDKVAASYPFFGTPELLARIACEAVEDAAADGCAYLELRFGPATHVRDGWSVDDVVRAACEGVRLGVARSGMPAGIVVAALRKRSAESNLAVARAAARFAGDGVVGFDLAGDESVVPQIAPFVDCYAVARAAGLGLTCHAAEAAPGFRAREAVELLGVTRIGHGAHLAADPELLRWAAGSGVTVEVCPTSNWFTGAIGSVRAHPAPVFAAAGVGLVLGDDNPVQTRSPLSAEREVLTTALGFAPDDLAALDARSVEVGFMPDSTRAALRARAAEMHSNEGPEPS
ncbi:adenosine deaminase [Spongisporangium articulatum]|uniref:adenosine deaminase n=1 Tax=Spongisporangium articulatum TaxID=3362603 RepID=A0ABW8AJY6_9ACTN